MLLEIMFFLSLQNKVSENICILETKLTIGLSDYSLHWSKLFGFITFRVFGFVRRLHYRGIQICLHCNDESGDRCVHGYQAICYRPKRGGKGHLLIRQKLIQIPQKDEVELLPQVVRSYHIPRRRLRKFGMGECEE